MGRTAPVQGQRRALLIHGSTFRSCKARDGSAALGDLVLGTPYALATAGRTPGAFVYIISTECIEGKTENLKLTVTPVSVHELQSQTRCRLPL